MTISTIPSGQPYGQRQRNEEAAAAAGTPTRVQQESPQALPTIPKQAVQAPPFDPTSDFDALSETTPTQFGNLRTPGEPPIVQTLATSPSPVLREVARRLRFG